MQNADEIQLDEDDHEHSGAAAEAAFLAILQKYAPAKQAERTDTLQDRYSISLHSPLHQLSTPLARAYEARDERDAEAQIYALVLPSHLSYREKALAALQNFSHPHLVKLLAYGPVQLSSPQEKRMVAIVQKPLGKRLSEILAEKKPPLPGGFVMEKIIAPLADLIHALSGLGITHGRLNLDTVYFGDRVMLGECISEPCGYSQPFLFETPERMGAAPIGKGDGDGGTDGYALAVLALHLSAANPPLAQLDQDNAIARVAQLGAYTALVGEREFSENLLDLFKGMFTDHKHERWMAEQLKAWSEGKRYNLLTPSPPTDAPRPFDFADREYFSRKSLAHAFFTHWDLAKKELRDSKLARWIELSAHKAELTELIQKISRSIDTSRGEKQQSELVARTIIVLDPFGPIRLRTLACAIDGLGAMAADSFHANRQQDLNYIAEIIENDLPSLQADLQRSAPHTDVSQVVWRLQRVRITLRMNALGYGMERCLYDLNPHLPCQSPLVLQHHITNLQEMLQTLDSIAANNARNHSPLDRHIAAFIASKMELAKEIKFPELGAFPALVNNPELVTLKLLAQAQEKAGNRPLKGLAAWMGLRLQSVLSFLHNRAARDRLQKDLRRAVESGKMENILNVVIDPALAQGDQQGFYRALHRYHDNARRIEQLRSGDLLAKSAKKSGLKLAMLIGYIAFFTSAYIVLGDYLNW